MGVILVANISDLWVESTLVFFMLLFFFLFGVLMLYVTYLNTKEWRYYGKTPLKINPFPGAIGGNLEGRVLISRNYRNKKFKITLCCVEHYMTPSLTGSSHGKNKSKSLNKREKNLWSNELYAEKETAPNGICLAFSFAIPRELPESQDPSGNYHYWKLIVESEGGSDIMLDRSFVVPVYNTN